ncbi:hypothetical protein RJ639_030472 [Escallonia herrerae]|uniref:Auxin-responsive protein n=1 Tax=Escallonia herrerae TaxID=1293975 RepID=A0AA88X1C5_9ASTE|nr:hypothetical protein RJ639_030472 [Escallonia herrerae]
MTNVMGPEKDEYRLQYEETELRLGLPGGSGKDGEAARNNAKRGFLETVDLKLNISSEDSSLDQVEEKNVLPRSGDPAKPPAKAQVVGWPPVRSFRKNILAVQKKSTSEGENTGSSAAFVKVSMDGNCGSEGMEDFMNESKLIDLLNGSDYVPSYEDKDGDWMLVGDVPWEMFVDSCKRLRIMKGSEAIGLAPRAVEKFKNRS